MELEKVKAIQEKINDFSERMANLLRVERDFERRLGFCRILAVMIGNLHHRRLHQMGLSAAEKTSSALHITNQEHILQIDRGSKPATMYGEQENPSLITYLDLALSLKQRTNRYKKSLVQNYSEVSHECVKEN